MADEVHVQVAGPQDQLPAGEVAAQQGPEPGEELGEGERLDQVVVRPFVQAPDTVLDRVAGRQDQDRIGRSRSTAAPEGSFIPSRPGSIRSSTIALTASPVARASPSSPVEAVTTS